ncbi:hypothetical protein [Mycolicibacterium sp.]|uniref:hypothetical protein n=1 Tax=Mycolicibacterium sp. TaxID=2320850 RepID=UPI0028A94D29|nr:hypothetical protein [Mycolicibacterium sp.]
MGSDQPPRLRAAGAEPRCGRAIPGAWAYTDTLGDIAKGVTGQVAVQLALFLTLLAGGGVVMGVGFSVGPGPKNKALRG